MELRAKETALVLLLALASSCLMCAKEGMPPGGPEDTTSPEVVSVLPPTGSTEVPLDARLQIVFSESMEQKITEQSIFVSPLPKEPFEFGWKGRKLMLSPQEPLRPDRTYVISVGADAQDLRRNRLGQTYTFAFSTGSRLDFGSISGRVWIKHEIGLRPEAGAGLWAYLLTEAKSEADPATDKPDYVTQTDDEGGFLLENLGLGTYRLFAVQDLNRDLTWNRENEPIGVTTGDAELTEQETSAADLDFILEKKDKKSPSLSNCLAFNRRSVRLEFDEELEARSALDTANYRLISALTGRFVGITSAFFLNGSTREVALLTQPAEPGEEYYVTVLGVRDRAGNPVDTSANSCRFRGSEIPDTTRPAVSNIDPAEGEANVSLSAGVVVTFSEPPDRQTVEESFFLLDSGSTSVGGTGEWVAPNVYFFSANSPLAGGMQFRANLRLAGVRDELGNVSGVDSVFTSSFVTVNQDTLGSVSGTVDVEGGADVPPVGLTLWHLQQKDLLYRLILTEPGAFEFGAVLPGKYFLAAWLDFGEDGVLSPGEPEPFLGGEPFRVYPDTIHVRPRWESQGVKLLFRRR